MIKNSPKICILGYQDMICLVGYAGYGFGRSRHQVAMYFKALTAAVGVLREQTGAANTESISNIRLGLKKGERLGVRSRPIGVCEWARWRKPTRNNIVASVLPVRR